MSSENDRRCYMLSFDHRGSIEKELLGLTTEPDADERARISALKEIIYAGFRKAVAEGAPKDGCGVLVDEEFGAGIARSAKAAGYMLAMPVEQTGRQDFEFEFEFGDEFGAHIEAFDPTFAKVLVRYNPDVDAELNSRQEARLARLTRWLRDHQRELLLELLVPATEAQLAQVDDDGDAYDRTLRPALVVRTLAALQDAGVEPRIWKVEGLDDSVSCERVVAQARKDGRNDVECVVLGRGADSARVVGWLQQAAPVPGYIGFAVGRTIWEDALREHLADRLDGAAASERIAHEYRRMIDVYAAAADSTTAAG
jgi:myo-inositol catabolism protein IolC